VVHWHAMTLWLVSPVMELVALSLVTLVFIPKLVALLIGLKRIWSHQPLQYLKQHQPLRVEVLFLFHYLLHLLDILLCSNITKVEVIIVRIFGIFWNFLMIFFIFLNSWKSSLKLKNFTIFFRNFRNFEKIYIFDSIFLEVFYDFFD
jgi:hypothetical protein